MKLCAVTIALLAFTAAPLAAIPVNIHLTSGRKLDVDLERVSKENVVWRLRPGDAVTHLTALAEIAYIDFPEPAEWEVAQNVLAAGDLDAALEKFDAIAKNRSKLGYPAPGNYASQALVQLLAIHRSRLDAAAIAEQARVLVREAPTLPPEMRDLDPVIDAWIAVGNEEYEAALKAIEPIEDKDENSEVAYLRGRALEGIGESAKAVESYAGTYTLSIGDRSEMSRDALRRSAVILDALGKEERLPEIHAQLKLYQELYGAGSLWDGAPEHLAKTAAAELELMKGAIDKPDDAGKPAPEPEEAPEPEPAPESKPNP